MYRKFTPENVKLIPKSAKKVFEGIMYSVWQWEQELFDGSTMTFEMLSRPDTVEIIAIVDDKIIVNQEEQPHFGAFLDIPGGRHDYQGDNELQCAQRELEEETGYTLSEWKLVQVTQPDSKIDRLIYTFVAYGQHERGVQNLDSGEKIMVLEQSFKEFSENVKNLRSYRNIEKLVNKVTSIEDIKNLPDLYS